VAVASELPTQNAEGSQVARSAVLHIAEGHILIDSVHRTFPLYLFCFQFLKWRHKSPAAHADALQYNFTL
jgi:hypothetical protein